MPCLLLVKGLKRDFSELHICVFRLCTNRKDNDTSILLSSLADYLVEEAIQANGPVNVSTCGSDSPREVLETGPELVNPDLIDLQAYCGQVRPTIQTP